MSIIIKSTIMKKLIKLFTGMFSSKNNTIDAATKELIYKIEKTNISILKNSLLPRYSRHKINTRIYSLKEFNKKLQYCINSVYEENFKYMDIFKESKYIYLTDFIFGNIDYNDAEDQLLLFKRLSSEFIRCTVTTLDLNKNRLFSIMRSNLVSIYLSIHDLE